ncbi:hypothetical protein D4764_08G0010040 [Takifugu flavidus]|uniref:Uncharacterized protein n=1 Tax=Takifugu flavidus TaxID=433684 RepID=A0A5C6MUJ9_9TELE|nr:hypothetical protein D4764_08G0010040 [Takifugu flavidus]
MRRRHLSIRARTTVAQRLPADNQERVAIFPNPNQERAAMFPNPNQERVAIFRTYSRDKITVPSHITNMDEIPLTFNIPLTHKVEKNRPAWWRYAQRGTRSRRSPWFSAATETDRVLDDGRQTLLHKDYEATAGKLCHHMRVDCRRMGYDTVFMYCKSFHKINAEPEPTELEAERNKYQEELNTLLEERMEVEGLDDNFMDMEEEEEDTKEGEYMEDWEDMEQDMEEDGGKSSPRLIKEPDMQDIEKSQGKHQQELILKADELQETLHVSDHEPMVEGEDMEERKDTEEGEDMEEGEDTEEGEDMEKEEDTKEGGHMEEDTEEGGGKVRLTKCQALEQRINDFQNQKKQLKKRNHLNKAIIEKINIENKALQKKVKQLENELQNQSPTSYRITSFLMAQTELEAERNKYQEELNTLLEERMEVEGLDDNLNKQLMRMKDFSKNTNLISELEKQLHSFQDSVKVIKHKKKKKQFSLFQKIGNLFRSELEINKGKIDFLIQEKQEVLKKSRNLGNELNVLKNIITIHRDIQDIREKELLELRQQIRTSEEIIEKTRPSIYQRYLNFFGPGQSTHENELRKMSKDKKKYKLLKEQLKDVQKLLCSHQINAEKIQTKISGLHEKERALDFNLIELNSLTLKKQGKIV